MDSSRKHEIHSAKPVVVLKNSGGLGFLTGNLARFSVLAGLLFLCLATALVTYYFVGQSQLKLAKKAAAQEVLIADLSDQLSFSEQMRVNAEIASGVDQMAMEELRGDFVEQQAKYEQLEEKTNFYRSLMDSNSSNSGVYIHSLELSATSTENLFRYSILVAQRSADHQRVRGSLQIEVSSEKKSDGIQILTTKDLTGEEDRITLGFKFFQQVDGTFTLPTEFVPEKIRLALKIDGKSSTQLDEEFNWAPQTQF